MTSFAGAGVHHIALETDDIFAAAEALKASGAALLPIPANYYDDVAARFGLDAALVERMQSLSILYDRVGEGEFLHLYTTPFEERFYFELVQRRSGYDLYGAPNAPVRMAALAALRGPNLSQVLR